MPSASLLGIDLRLSPLTISVLLSSGLTAQSTTIVSGISVEGTQVTKQYVIRREIQHPIGVPLDSTLAGEDRDRIDNLAIFSSVVWHAVPQEDGSVELIYGVVETWRIWPGATPVYMEDRGWFLSGGVRILNFRGRNQMFGVGGAIGAVEMFGFEFSDPWIAGDHISMSLDVGKLFFQHPFLSYDQIIDSFEANFGRWFGYRWKVRGGFELERKQFAGESDRLSYTYIAPQASVVYDTRDIYRDPSKGGMISHSLYSMVDLTGRRKNLLSWTQSYSRYWTPLKGRKKLTLGAGVGAKLSFGAQDEVWVDYFGGSYTVRGWQVPNRDNYSDPSQTFRFGYHQFLASLEARQTIVPNSPVSASVFSAEVGLTGVVFFDLGYTSRELGDLFESDPLSGAGVGIRVPIPGGVLRIDHGWSFYAGEPVSRGINVGLGQKF